MYSIISFIGMSGVGKSHWSYFLREQYDYCHLDIDQCIADSLGLGDVQEVGSWLGMPYTPDYAQKAQQYLELEAEHTRQAISEATDRQSRVVIDTTGSFVHLPHHLRSELRACSHVVELGISEEEEASMINIYLATPKPVMFGDHYSRLSDESEQESLERCYRALLRWRRGEYGQVAHQSLLAADPQIESQIVALVESIR